MADLSDVGNALVAIAAQTMYPNGTGQASVAGCDVRVYQGWPVPQQLDADLAAGLCHVSVYPTQIERNTSRYPKDWQTLDAASPTLTATIAGQTVTIGGAIPATGNVSIEANGLVFVYAVQLSDTLTSIATALAALIVAGIAGTTSSGAVITIPTSAKLTAARVGAAGTIAREIRRQERQFQISVWADSPAHRDAVSQPLDIALTLLQFIALTDGFAARLIYKGSRPDDSGQKMKIYRRDLNYTVEYAATQSSSAVQVTQVQVNVAAQPAGATAPISNIQINL